MNRNDLLRWLAREQFSLYGECHGEVLDSLIAEGLAMIVWKGLYREYDRVSLTEAGFARAEELGEA